MEALEDLWGDPDRWAPSQPFEHLQFPTGLNNLNGAASPAVTLVVVADAQARNADVALATLKALEYPNFETLLLDLDPSSTAFCDAVVTGFPDACVVPASQGDDLGTALRELAELSVGDYLVVVRCDAPLEPQALDDLIRPLEFWPEIEQSAIRLDELEGFTAPVVTEDAELELLDSETALVMRRDSISDAA